MIFLKTLKFIHGCKANTENNTYKTAKIFFKSQWGYYSSFDIDLYPVRLWPYMRIPYIADSLTAEHWPKNADIRANIRDTPDIVLPE